MPDRAHHAGRRRRIAAAFAIAAAVGFAFPAATRAQTVRIDPSRYAALRWRNIGPFRGGRAVAVSGVTGDPRTFYLGAVGGGVWKSGNAGRTWSPVMDSQPVASIGAIAVAPSDPNTIYVGSGEADMRSDIVHGNGMYRSTDGGASWAHVGLDDSRQIGRILIDPKDPKTLLVSALGHAYGPNDTRGVYRSTDGGATWARTLFLDRDTGAIDLAGDSAMHTVYASLWQTRRPPWSVYPPSSGPGSGLYKSTDGGATWAPVRGNGFASAAVGKIGIAVAPSDPKRVYAIVDANDGGLYRSNDAGATWKRTDAEYRIWQRGWYFCHVTVDPKNADVVYVSNTSLYRSTTAGATFTPIKGSPDGDDFHQLWIDPSDASRMVLGSDQGATVSIDGGASWSSWFNQPTGQFYHVVTDNAFPYRLYGAQQDSGAAMILSRSDHAGIGERDWRPLSAGGESGSIAPDPRDPSVAYGNEVVREDLRSNQTRSLSPTLGLPGTWRAEWTQPLAFGPGHALYAAAQRVFRSRDGGNRWSAISGDLTRARAPIPPTLDRPAANDADASGAHGVVYALAPSPLHAQTLWAGTDDGLVQLTIDGGRHWRNVTPPGVTAWSHVDEIDASHLDAASAYVAVDRHRLDDDRPYVFITHDFGRTWRAATAGIPNGSYVNTVRADPVRRGLLYAATDTGVFVSFDDGRAWSSLRLNMPVVPVRDIRVHDGDLAIATHGRAFWILDDVAPLRELAANADSGARLFAPRSAYRTRPGNDEAEASPPETRLGENPPYGSLIDYAVPAGAARAVTLTVLDAQGNVVRRWASSDRSAPTDPKSVDYPAYWLTAPAQLSGEPGMHRFAWDMHAGSPDGPLVPPGRYVVRLRAADTTTSRSLTLLRDPRVRARDPDLVAQYRLARDVDALRARVRTALVAATAARARPGANVARIDALAGAPASADQRSELAAAVPAPTTLRWFSLQLGALEDAVESADDAPTANERAVWTSLRAGAGRALHAWEALRSGRVQS